MANPKMTGISSITGKTVTIRHATETDMVFIAETLKKNRMDEDDLSHTQFVVAEENDDIIGFGRLRKTGDAYDIGCVFVVESGRKRGIGASIIRHLIEYAPVNSVYTVTDAKAYLRKLGFTEEKQTPKELRGALDVACNLKGRTASVLMTYEKR